MLIESKEIVQNPLVSVIVLVYNAEKYLRKCLDGIVMQKVDFPYEVIVGEDCSTDKSKAICLEYQEKYPHLFRLVLHEKNQGLIGNLKSIYALRRGELHTGVAGDDYWCDTNKLQMQVDYMMSHPECGLCYTNVITCDDDGVENPKPLLTRETQPTTFEEQLFSACYMAPNTWMSRADVGKKIGEQLPWFTDESLATALDFLHESNMHFIDTVTTVYRVHEGSLASQTDPMKKWKYEHGLMKMQVYYAEKYHCSEELIMKLKLQEYVHFIPSALEAGDMDFVQEALDYGKSQGMELKWVVGTLKQYVEYHRQYEMIRRSKAYRLGKALLKPLKWLKK